MSGNILLDFITYGLFPMLAGLFIGEQIYRLLISRCFQRRVHWVFNRVKWERKALNGLRHRNWEEFEDSADWTWRDYRSCVLSLGRDELRRRLEGGEWP